MKSIPIGLKDFHYAVMDDVEAESYEAPAHIPGSITANVSPTTNSSTLYADDIAYDMATSLGDIALSLNLADIPTADLAALLGHAIDANGVLIRSKEDEAPYVAIGYKRKMANHKYRYVWLLKGKFRLEEQNANTKTEQASYQTTTINATFLPRETDGDWQSVVNEGDPGVSQAVLDDWFDAVYLKDADEVPPTVVTVVPANLANNVEVGTQVTWTFSEPIRTNTINSGNFMLLDSSMEQVAGALDYNSAATVVTLTPAGDLGNDETYTTIVTTGVKDVAGNSLEAPKITTFITELGT
ncbi:major tail protein [Candidatus Contubernalis alkaliaceticus]|uniref:major tail protein n=1 Tax=Candidatus Contubernalis alkaliaceticus TaxID=338645 RepID=UPI001F4C3DBC|nr:major tail protein [Candidatus Contubernalis alkalaceticus]UNC91695.1 Ig-like domain-containing protein [Candidatus Contubernalis alkalaceticus]